MLLTYCKNSFRQLAQTPAFTFTALLTLLLGIGMTTAVFSIVEGVLLRPLPFKDPQRLVKVSDQVLGVADEGSQVPLPT